MSMQMSDDHVTPLEACRWITDLSAGWDENGSTGPKRPYSWETVARMAMDYARGALKNAEDVKS